MVLQEIGRMGLAKEMPFASVATFDETETLFCAASSLPGRADAGRFSYALLGGPGIDRSGACREGLPIASGVIILICGG